jgi:OmpA-OmpF porin, OOP family
MTKLLTSLALLLSLAAHAADEAPKADVPGSSDHPVLSRFSGSLLVGYRQQDWAQRELPSAEGTGKAGADRFEKPLKVEGRVTQLYYLGPLGKSPLEVFRNHQQALQAAGFKLRWGCDRGGPEGCAKPYFALQKHDRMQGMAWAKGSLQGVTGGKSGTTWSLPDSISYEEGRLMVGTLSRAGQTLELLLYTSVADNEHTQRAATYIEIVEPKAMQTGQVTVDLNAIQAGLKDEGRIALYGLQFDTGKSVLKPESQAQLAPMVALLKGQPALKVFIVGHTDNVGAFEANRALSLARAQAVVAALQQAGIAADRLSAQAAASFAPVASNASEAGRAKNRRVELVAQ